MKIKDLLETRKASFEFIKGILPLWPKYVVRDFVYNNLAKGVHGLRGDEPFDWGFDSDAILGMLHREGLTPDTKWTLIPNFEFKMDKLTPDTQERLKARAGGDLNPYQVPNDAERHAKQAELAKKQGGIRKEPVILIKRYNGYELMEGWHRTIQHFKMYPDGYRGPAWIAVARSIKENFADGKEPDYLWHGSRQKIEMLEPRQAIDTGGVAGSNQNAIYATSNPKIAIAMGLTTPGSDTGMFPNDPQMVLFSGKIRKGENVYLHKLPFNGPDGKPQFVQGGNSREFHSIPGVKGIKPTEIKKVPVDKYLNLIRQATPQDLLLRKKYMKKGVEEGNLNESAIFLNPKTVIVGQEHGKPLNLSQETLKKVQAIAAKHGAWYEGNGADRAYTKGTIDKYVGSFDDEVAKNASPDDPKWLYVLFANVDANNRVNRVGVDPKDTIFNRLLATAQDNSFQGIGFTQQALQRFLSMCSEGKYNFVKMSQQPATKENLTRFLKAGESLMWPSNWEQYPNKAGKIAKAATVDARDQYLANRTAGVYVVGSGHLKAIQQISGKPYVAENFADGKGPGRAGDSQRHGIPKHATIAQLEKAAKAKGRKGQLARWQLNMRRGKKKVKEAELLEADKVVTIMDKPVEIMINPGYQRMLGFAKRINHPILRALYVPSQDVVVVWPAEAGIHYQMAQALVDQLGWDLGGDLKQAMTTHRLNDPLHPQSAILRVEPPLVDSTGKIKKDTNIHKRAGEFSIVALPKFYNIDWWDRIKRTAPPVTESWSKKYKKSINCSNPKGFSQRAHCAGRKKRRAHGKTKSHAVREDMNATQKELATKLAKLSEHVNLVQLPTVQGTKTFIVDLDRRPIVLVNFSGHVIPFYCSTGMGGKATVASGKWYPFWGIGSDGWFNKGTEEMINNFYYSKRLANTAASLNQYLGNLVGNRDIPIAGASAVTAINQNQRPKSQTEARKDLIAYYAGITTQIRTIG